MANSTTTRAAELLNNLFNEEVGKEILANEDTFDVSYDDQGNLVITEQNGINWSNKLQPFFPDTSNLGTFGPGTLFWRVEDETGYRRIESCSISETGEGFDDWLIDHLPLVGVLGTVERVRALYDSLSAVDPREVYDEEISYEGPTWFLVEVGDLDPTDLSEALV